MRINPYSFLHVVNPGFRIDRSIKGIERFQLIRKRYLEFLDQEIFVRDPSPSYYVYEVRQSGFTFKGFLGATSVEDYNDNTIRKHEETLQNKEDLFAHYLKTVGFNSEPVLITHKEEPLLSQILEETCKRRPEVEIVCSEGDTHCLWRISEGAQVATVEEGFKKQSELYIADGHHRSASSAQYFNSEQRRRPDMDSDDPARYFMSYLIPEEQVKIYGFSRYVTDLNGLSAEGFLERLGEYFEVHKVKGRPRVPEHLHRFLIYLPGSFYELELKASRIPKEQSIVLDTVLLYDNLLKPILGIGDLRSDQRIAYSSGKQSLPDMKNAVDSGKFALAIALHPLSIDELKMVADDNLVMPPKTTYIEPKMRNGLVIYELFQ